MPRPTCHRAAVSFNAWPRWSDPPGSRGYARCGTELRGCAGWARLSVCEPYELAARDGVAKWGDGARNSPTLGCGPRGPWPGLEDVEFATLEWVAWFNTARFLEPVGYISPVEFEEAYYRNQQPPAMVAESTNEPPEESAPFTLPSGVVLDRAPRRGLKLGDRGRATVLNPPGDYRPAVVHMNATVPSHDEVNATPWRKEETVEGICR